VRLPSASLLFPTCPIPCDLTNLLSVLSLASSLISGNRKLTQ